MARIRAARRRDIARYAGAMPAAAWCVTRVVGWALERDDGGIAALGIVTWDEFGRAWGWFSGESLPAVAVHRRARAMLAVLRLVGEPALHCFCSREIAGAERWLCRLGFRPAPELDHAILGPVWRCDLS